MKFKYEPWNLSEDKYCKEALKNNSTLFFLGNGYLGLRGSFEEDSSNLNLTGKGMFINGFYETEPIIYGEEAFGFPKKSQSIINLPDSTEISIYFDDEVFNCDVGKIIDYSRSLSLKEGILKRSIIWESAKGQKAKIEFTRCVSMKRKHLALVSCKISEVENTKKVRIISTCRLDVPKTNQTDGDPRKSSGFKHNPLICQEKIIENNRAVVSQKTASSGLSFYECVSNNYSENLEMKEQVVLDNSISFVLEGVCLENSKQTFIVDKFISFYTSIECEERDLKKNVVNEVVLAEGLGADRIIEEQVSVVKDFWDTADVEIDGDNLVQGIRFNIFSMYQSAGTDGLRNIAAKGLSGEGYEGHFFWDSEIYIIPFFTYTFPEIASKLLEYRYHTLDKARERAKEMNEQGAMYPWRTINGEEASAFFPAGTAQYHINADIAYGISKYYSLTGDFGFLRDFGLEILIETARMWVSLGFFDNIKKEFRINCVTGPDEYTAIVNNNFYTNAMARNNLLKAVEALNLIKEREPEWYKTFSEKMGLNTNEICNWEKAAKMMYLPYDKNLCVDAQDDTFLNKEMWDFSDKELNKFPLLLNLHPLVIYRYQILKQPDVVLSNFLLGNEFTKIQKMRDYAYYNKITTGDSSLAPCIQSIMAAELGHTEVAYNYFMRTVRMDIDNINSNVDDGIHIAAMGGSWMSLIYGFAGLRDYDGKLSFLPRLPKEWNLLSFKLRHKDCLLLVKLTQNTAEYTLSESSLNEIEFKHWGDNIILQPGETLKTKMSPTLKAVIFDLDGVITDTSELHYQAWKKLADEEGYVFSREINEQLRGVSRLASLNIILETSNIKVSEEEKNKQAARKNEYYKEMLLSLNPDNILPGIRSFFDSLKDRGIKTALASASRNAATVLKRLDMTKDFDVIMDAGAIEKGKPDPEIFVSAAEKLGFYTEQCVGIEDAEAGVVAIRDGGIFSVGIGPAAKNADLYLDNTNCLDIEHIKECFIKYRKF